MHATLRNLAASAALLAGGALLLAGAAPEGAPNNYTFRAAPVNAMGVAGMGDLRGKPVLIDFWGTR